MKSHKSILTILFVGFLSMCVPAWAIAQTEGDGKLAVVTGGGSTIRWDVLAANSGGTLTVSTPDNRSFTRNFRAGSSPEFSLSDKQLESLPDGVYSYELRLSPLLTPAQKEALAKARGKDDDPESERAGRKPLVVPSLVQAGSFSVLNGMIILPGGVEGKQSAVKKAEQPKAQVPTIAFANPFRRNHRFLPFAVPDVVTADDEIIQGSLCVGLDCVNNESFGFDTIRLKENNTRISFNDTSTAAGFPTNDWTIRANSSSSGGANFLAFVDRGTSENGDETGTIVFEVDAGASANALRVASNSKVGLRTATPVLDVHITTTDTPAIRQEQTNGGGFTAQTWDIGANEANWFVRDVTGGSRLPFRIRPGAPTSSIDISATGNVGINTASPTARLDVNAGGTTHLLLGADSDVPTYNVVSLNGSVTDTGHLGLAGGGGTDKTLYLDTPTGGSFNFRINVSCKMFMDSSGNVGIGTTSPTQLLSVNGTAGKPGGGTWDVFSDERLKNIKGRYNTGLKALMQLQPLRYEYKSDNALGIKLPGEQIGFGAQSVQKVIPEAVSQDSSGYLMVKSDPILWTMLNAIKEQQQEIVALRKEVRKLRASSRTRRR